MRIVAGTIKDNEKDRLQRLLFRTTRGRTLTFFNDFALGLQKKTVYMIVY